MDDFERDGDEFSVIIPLDAHGMIGRECPNPDCRGYFKIEPGTGLSGEDLLCTCPYCGEVKQPDHFWTQEQLDYAESLAVREYMNDFDEELKLLERKPARGAWFGISIHVESTPYPVARYAEKDLETELVCDRCTLRYAIYGVFGYCPDCGVHNSFQMLRSNLDLVQKMVEMSSDMEPALQRAMLENALQSAVAAFDGFGRELCRTYAHLAVNPQLAGSLSFQSIDRAADQVNEQFQVNLQDTVSPTEWRHTVRQFQKRHVLAHRSGVVDQQYLNITADHEAVLGRKIAIQSDDIMRLTETLNRCAERVHQMLSARAS